MDFQYLFIFPFLREASKKEHKFSFFPPIFLLKMAWRERMQRENKVKGCGFYKIGLQNRFPYSGLRIQSNTFFFFFLFKKRNPNTVAYISTRVSFIKCFHKKKRSELWRFVASSYHLPTCGTTRFCFLVWGIYAHISIKVSIFQNKASKIFIHLKSTCVIQAKHCFPSDFLANIGFSVSTQV